MNKLGRKPEIFDGLVPPGMVRGVAAKFLTSPHWQYGRVSASHREQYKAWTLPIAGRDYRIDNPDLHSACLLLLSCVEDNLLALGCVKPGYRIFRIAGDGRTDGQFGYTHADARPDGARGANAISVLYYINDVWKPEWRGPTLFFDDATPEGKLASPRLARKAAVISEFVPGRFAVFRSSVVHASTPPENRCERLRATLSFVLTN